MKRTLHILEGVLELVDTWRNGEVWMVDENERLDDFLREHSGKRVKITIEEID